eukprot:gene7430-biopygen555
MRYATMRRVITKKYFMSHRTPSAAAAHPAACLSQGSSEGPERGSVMAAAPAATAGCATQYGRGRVRFATIHHTPRVTVHLNHHLSLEL